MSLRQLRKIQKQKELLQFQQTTGANNTRGPNADEPEPEPEPEHITTKPRASLFAALAADDDQDEDEQLDGESDEQATREAVEHGPPPRTTRVRKGKKKKK